MTNDTQKETDLLENIPLEDDFYAERHPKMESVIGVNPPPLEVIPPWDQLLPKLKLTGMASALASHCVVGNFNGHLCILHLASKHAPLNTKAVADRIAQSLTDIMKKPIAIEIKLTDAVVDTPAQRRQEADDQAFAQAKTQLESDPVVQQLVETFDAKIDESTVKRGSL